jgi:hypothetical protein
MDRGEWKEAMGMWNGAVDKYIASGVDRRSVVIIENAAKLGMLGGPLHRKCEASGCTRVEGRDGLRIMICSRCTQVRRALQSLCLFEVAF